MSDTYQVSIKDSVFRETHLTEADFDDDRTLEFESKAAAEQWVGDRDEEHDAFGHLRLHTAHPNDSSDDDAYLIFDPTQGIWVPDS